jgi:predicted phosphodiesterase
VVRQVGLIGDVHAEDEILAVALGHLGAGDGLDAILCVGDVVTGPGDAGRCCDLLAGASVLTVRGNHDRWFLTGTPSYAHLPKATPPDHLGEGQHRFLASLPPLRGFETPRGALMLCHGLGDDDTAAVYSHDATYALESNHRLHALASADEFRFLVNGHTHDRMVRNFDGLTIINAGTLRRDKSPCFATADFAAGIVQFFGIHPQTHAIAKTEFFLL